MVSSGYGTEATVESIWSTLWDTTQFGHINVIIGTKFNYYITDDGATDITNTAVTTMLAAETNELFALWNSMIKESAVTNPWDFIRLWMDQHLSGDKFYRRYSILIKKAQQILGETTIELVRKTLPSSATDW